MLIYDPRKGDKIAQRLSLRGNPSEKTDFFIEPKTNEVMTSSGFARTEGRSRNTSTRTSETLERKHAAEMTNLDAPDRNWRGLFEDCGCVRPRTRLTALR